MKKTLIILFFFPLIFISCEKEDDSPNSNPNSDNNPTVNTTTGYIFTGVGEIFKTDNYGNNWSVNDGEPFNRNAALRRNIRPIIFDYLCLIFN